MRQPTYAVGRPNSKPNRDENMLINSQMGVVKKEQNKNFALLFAFIFLGYCVHVYFVRRLEKKKKTPHKRTLSWKMNRKRKKNNSKRSIENWERKGEESAKEHTQN